ncbi:MAG: FAD-dependent oxidoreductase, partial [Acidobacteriota bacterium]|nr:FAD-dependent oxidoreductase [Acidobacteriota bacterium]
MNETSDIYDAVIVGGGPAGASAAIHLAMNGARVLLAEQKRFPREKLCGEFISPECLEHFERLGVMGRMREAGGADLAETVFYSMGGKCVSVPSYWFGGSGACALGLSRAEMDARLLARARDAGAFVLEEATASGLLMEGGRVRGVRFKQQGSPLEFRSLIAIDATGRSRQLARRAEREGRTGKSALVRRAPLVAFKAHLENARGNL